MSKARELKLAILGYGNAGRAFGKLLHDKHDEIKKNFGVDVKVVAIATKTKGSLIDPAGIDLVKIEKELYDYGKFMESICMDALEMAKSADYDVLIELTPLEIMTGEPAISHLKAAFSRKKHAITANKGPIAWAFRELKDLAAKNSCLFFYETTVMDGTPVFNLVDETLPMCKVTEVSGILNTTTNFILEELAKGVPYNEVLEESRRRGFVESDPDMDIKGFDAAAKVTALLNVLMDAGITPNDIDRKGIEDITVSDIKNAADNGCVIKLVCKGEIKGGKVYGSVKPLEIDKSDILATVSGTSSLVSITTDLMGKVTVVEHDPEIEQTAFGVFSDLIRVIQEGGSL